MNFVSASKDNRRPFILATLITCQFVFGRHNRSNCAQTAWLQKLNVLRMPNTVALPTGSPFVSGTLPPGCTMY